MGQSTSHHNRGLKNRQSTRSLPDVATGNRLIDEDARWAAYANGHGHQHHAMVESAAAAANKSNKSATIRAPPTQSENRTLKNNTRTITTTNNKHSTFSNANAPNTRPIFNAINSGVRENPVRSTGSVGIVASGPYQHQNAENFLNFERNYLANCPPTVPPRRVGGPRSFDGNFTRHQMVRECARSTRARYPGNSDRFDDSNWSDIASDMYRIKKKDIKSGMAPKPNDGSRSSFDQNFKSSCSKMNSRCAQRKAKHSINESGSTLSRVPENSAIHGVDEDVYEENYQSDYNFEQEDGAEPGRAKAYAVSRSRDRLSKSHDDRSRGAQKMAALNSHVGCRSSSCDQKICQFGSKKSGLDKNGSNFKLNQFKGDHADCSPVSEDGSFGSRGGFGRGENSLIQNLRRDLNSERTLRVNLEKRTENDSRVIENLNKKIDHLQRTVEMLMQKSTAAAVSGADSMKQCSMDANTLERDETFLNLVTRVEDLERENKRLELMNKRQKLDFDQCLQEIAGRVAQAVLNEKTLKSECVRLQKRLLEIEWKNKLQLTDGNGNNDSNSCLATPIKNFVGFLDKNVVDSDRFSTNSSLIQLRQEADSSRSSSSFYHQNNACAQSLTNYSASRTNNKNISNLCSLNLNAYNNNFDSNSLMSNNLDIISRKPVNAQKEKFTAVCNNGNFRATTDAKAICTAAFSNNGNRLIEQNEYAELFDGGVSSLKDQNFLGAPNFQATQSASPVSNGGEGLCSRPVSFSFDAHSLAPLDEEARQHHESAFSQLPVKNERPNDYEINHRIHSTNLAVPSTNLKTSSSSATPGPTYEVGGSSTPACSTRDQQPRDDEEDDGGATPVHSPNKREIVVNFMQFSQQNPIFPFKHFAISSKNNSSFLNCLRTGTYYRPPSLAQFRNSNTTNDDGYSTMSSAVLMGSAHKLILTLDGAQSNSTLCVTSEMNQIFDESDFDASNSFIFKKSHSDSRLFIRSKSSTNRKGIRSLSADDYFCLFFDNSYGKVVVSEHSDLTEVERDLLLFEKFDSRREGLCDLKIDHEPVDNICSHDIQAVHQNYNLIKSENAKNEHFDASHNVNSSSVLNHSEAIISKPVTADNACFNESYNETGKSNDKTSSKVSNRKSRNGNVLKNLNESVCTTSSCTSDDSEYAANLLMRERWNQLKVKKAGTKTSVVRYKPPSSRAVIINKGSSLRSCVYYRFGRLERSALTTFDFLNGERSRSSTPRRNDRYDQGRHRTSSSESSVDQDTRRHRRRPSNQKKPNTKAAPPRKVLSQTPHPVSCESLHALGDASGAQEEIYANMPYHRLVRTMSEENVLTLERKRSHPKEWALLSSRSCSGTSSKRHSLNGGCSTPSLFLSQLELSAAAACDRTFSSNSSLSIAGL